MKKHYSLKELAAYARNHGYTVVEIKYDHIVAINNYSTIRTASMETLKKITGGTK